jgi:uncharacterized DUF497 family protein
LGIVDSSFLPERSGVHGTGSTSLLDALALTVFDAEHSQVEERWFTLGMATDGMLLAVSHTYTATAPGVAEVRIISARPATRSERQRYENSLRWDRH